VNQLVAKAKALIAISLKNQKTIYGRVLEQIRQTGLMKTVKKPLNCSRLHCKSIQELQRYIACLELYRKRWEILNQLN
jgi:hypothetical protein